MWTYSVSYTHLDKVAVCISGGKDSMLLAKCMQQLKRQSTTSFELEFIVMDPGYHVDNRRLIEENAAKLNIPIRIFDSEIFDIVAVSYTHLTPPHRKMP